MKKLLTLSSLMMLILSTGIGFAKVHDYVWETDLGLASNYRVQPKMILSNDESKLYKYGLHQIFEIDAETGEVSYTFDDVIPEKYKDGIFSFLQISNDDSKLYLYGYFKTFSGIFVIDIAERKLIQEKIFPHDDKHLFGLDYSKAFGTFFAGYMTTTAEVTSYHVMELDADDFSVLKTIETAPKNIIQLSPDGTKLVLIKNRGNNRSRSILDAATLESYDNIPAEIPESFYFTPDNQYIFSYSAKELQIWRFPSFELAHHLNIGEVCEVCQDYKGMVFSNTHGLRALMRVKVVFRVPDLNMDTWGYLTEVVDIHDPFMEFASHESFDATSEFILSRSDEYIYYANTHITYKRPLDWSPAGVASNDLLPESRSYPNPAEDLLSIDFTLGHGSATLIEIVNISGFTVQSTDVGFLSSGEQHIELDVSALPAGVYLVQISSGTHFINQKFIKTI